MAAFGAAAFGAGFLTAFERAGGARFFTTGIGSSSGSVGSDVNIGTVLEDLGGGSEESMDDGLAARGIGGLRVTRLVRVGGAGSGGSDFIGDGGRLKGEAGLFTGDKGRIGTGGRARGAANVLVSF